MATPKDLLEQIYDLFKMYIAGTAALDEAFPAIKYLLDQMPEAERTVVIQDRLWQFGLKTDVEKGPLVGGQPRNLGTLLVVRLWAASPSADKLSGHIFAYINSADRKWDDLWTNVLHELRFSMSEYRSHFSKPALAQTADYCRWTLTSDAASGLKQAAEGLIKTIERMEFESIRPKIPPAQPAAISKPKKSKFGLWNIIESLSEGGQGRTFLVSKNGEATVYVLKELKNRNRLGRFKNEIQAGLTLNHPNIVRVVEHHLDGEPYYFVMEYCEGRSLREWKGLSHLSLVERLQLFLGICAGVAFAHRMQTHIIHRDLKPDNIFIRADGTPAVGDFGICFITDQGERLTFTDEAAGPRNYIAPELEDGRVDEVRPHSDVYSLGKVLFWMLTGREFAREKHRQPQFDVTKKNETAEYFLINELLDRMIVADPAMRFKDANELAFAVEALIERIGLGGHVMDLSAPQRCVYCAEGHYKIIAEPLYENRQEARDKTANFSYMHAVTPSYSDPVWGVFVCDHCGNVQIFRPDQGKDPKVWKKS